MYIKSGDTIYFAGKFVKVAIMRGVPDWYETSERIHGSSYWCIQNPIIVKPDTPQNRLAVQLKYS